MRDHVKLFALSSAWYFSPSFFFLLYISFAMCKIANCAPPHSSRSRGALRPTRHSHSPERHWLGSVSQRGSITAVWHCGFNHASTPNTSAARRRGILWVKHHHKHKYIYSHTHTHTHTLWPSNLKITFGFTVCHCLCSKYPLKWHHFIILILEIVTELNGNS